MTSRIARLTDLVAAQGVHAKAPAVEVAPTVVEVALFHDDALDEMCYGLVLADSRVVVLTRAQAATLTDAFDTWQSVFLYQDRRPRELPFSVGVD